MPDDVLRLYQEESISFYSLFLITDVNLPSASLQISPTYFGGFSLIFSFQIFNDLQGFLHALLCKIPQIEKFMGFKSGEQGGHIVFSKIFSIIL